MHVRVFLLLILLLGVQAADIREPGNPPNTAEQRTKPYVLLVSLDGFRHDYLERYQATNLLKLAQSGIRAEGLIPVYPSLTFPSHYSIATGLRPEHHGLVGMRFYDPKTKAFFSYTDRACLTNSAWYGGTPLWVLAEKKGMRSAAFFWVGSEAEIQGVRPSLYAPYDGKVPNATRVETVLGWLRLPDALRPHFLMLYFSDVDAAGHDLGPESSAMRDAVQRVDAAIGILLHGLHELPFQVNLIVLSDHGMAVRKEERILLYEMFDLSGLVATSNGSSAAIYSADQSRLDALYQQARDKDPRFSVYRRSEIPGQLQYREHDRIGDLIFIPNGPYLLNVTPPQGPLPGGMHGYDPAKYPEMNGIFVAAGPNLARHVRTNAIDSLNVYPLILRILGLEPPPNLDGNFEPVHELYRP